MGERNDGGQGGREKTRRWRKSVEKLHQRVSLRVRYLPIVQPRYISSQLPFWNFFSLSRSKGSRYPTIPVFDGLPLVKARWPRRVAIILVSTYGEGWNVRRNERRRRRRRRASRRRRRASEKENRRESGRRRAEKGKIGKRGGEGEEDRRGRVAEQEGEESRRKQKRRFRTWRRGSQ